MGMARSARIVGVNRYLGIREGHLQADALRARTSMPWLRGLPCIKSGRWHCSSQLLAEGWAATEVKLNRCVKSIELAITQIAQAVLRNPRTRKNLPRSTTARLLGQLPSLRNAIDSATDDVSNGGARCLSPLSSSATRPFPVAAGAMRPYRTKSTTSGCAMSRAITV